MCDTQDGVLESTHHITKCAMRATVHAWRPPSGGGPGSIYDVVDLPVTILCRTPSLVGSNSTTGGGVAWIFSDSSLFSFAKTFSTSRPPSARSPFFRRPLSERLLLVVSLMVLVLCKVTLRAKARYIANCSDTSPARCHSRKRMYMQGRWHQSRLYRILRHSATMPIVVRFGFRIAYSREVFFSCICGYMIGLGKKIPVAI
jgi:hypothetical protein